MADVPEDNKYIRTFAKDMAALQGKGAPNPLQRLRPAAPSGTSDREGVLSRLRDRAAKEPAHENVLLPNSLPTPLPKVAPTEEHLPEKAPAVEPKPEPSVPAPAPKPFAPPPPPPRFAIFPTTPAPLPVAPPPPPVVVSVPTPPPSPPIPLFPKTPPVEVGPSPLHTYTSDFSDRVDSKEASAFSVLAAQSDASNTPVPQALGTPKKRVRLLVPIASIVLVLVGAGVAFGAYRYVATHSVVHLTADIPSLVFADDRQALTGEGPQLLQAFAASAASPLPEGQVRVLYLTEASTTPKGPTTIALSGGRLIGALQLSAPDILLRNIADESTVGIVHKGPESRAFFIIKVLSYERTFAGMLQWESTMASSLSLLYPAYPDTAIAAPVIATTTKVVNGKKVVVTTTTPAAPTVVTAPHFVDEVASNHDVRALKDGQGRTILLYGYKDKETLVLARDEAAFGELLNRLSATKQQ